MKIVLLALLVLAAIASEQNVTQGAGIAVHIRQELFDNLKESVLEEFVESIEVGHLSDFAYVADLTAFKVILNLTNMELHDFQLNVKKSYLKLQEQAPNLVLYIPDFSMKFTLDFDFRTDPPFILDKGNGELLIGNTELYIGYVIENSPEGRPKFKVSTATMNCSDFTLSMNGTADFSKVIDQLGGFLKEFIKDQINDYLVSIVQATVTPVINGAISSAYNTTYVFEKSILANFTSPVAPKFTEDDMTLFFKGEIRPDDEAVLPFVQDLKVPSDVNLKGRQLQIDISDYLFNSAIYSFYKKHYLEGSSKDVVDIPAEYIKMIFPQIKYDDSTPIWFDFKAIEHGYIPYIKIINGTTTAVLDFEANMYAQTSNPDLLLKLEGTTFIEVDVFIVEGFKLTVNAKTMKVQNIKILENHIDEQSEGGDKVDEEDIISFFGMITGFARNYINTFVNNFKVDLPIGQNINLDDISLYEKENYIYADVTPKISLGDMQAMM